MTTAPYCRAHLMTLLRDALRRPARSLPGTDRARLTLLLRMAGDAQGTVHLSAEDAAILYRHLPDPKTEPEPAP